jgi:hypothetical protein
MPDSSPAKYPSYTRDWGVEQDFHKFLTVDYPGLVKSRLDADFVYLPIYWTRYYLSNGSGHGPVSRVQEYLESLPQGPGLMFTVCQYDDGPLVHRPNLIKFLASRNSAEGFDVPLLADEMPRPIFSPGLFGAKKYKASFVGRTETHPLRRELQSALLGKDGILFDPSPRSPRSFSSVLSRSTITLCPRGHGGSSFRFWEAINHGSIPWLIGEIDTRPFKSSIDWEKCSYYSPNVAALVKELDGVDPEETHKKRAYLLEHVSQLFTWGKWCDLLISDLSLLFGLRP